MKTISIIGCGKVAQTLSYLWRSSKSFKIQQVLNRTIASSTKAVNFIGEGKAIDDFELLTPADIFFIGTNDDSIVSSYKRLINLNITLESTIVFHCSGLLSSTDLKAEELKLPLLASIHPIKSFSNSELAITTFQGTYCGIEGDEQALSILKPAFENIGASCFPIKAEDKALYHTATVFACNYLTTLLDLSMKIYTSAGIDTLISQKLTEKIVKDTVNNIFKLGTTNALTGPIARGDEATIKSHISKLSNYDPNIKELYLMLGNLTLKLAKGQNKLKTSTISSLNTILSSTS